MASVCLMLMLLIIATGCSGGDGDGTEDNAVPEKTEVLRSDLSHEDSPDVGPDELYELTEGNSVFAFDLYQALRDRDGNLFYSPYSISMALAMAYAGSRNETGQQMKSTCHFTLSRERLHPAFNALDIELATRGRTAEGQDGEGFRMNIANSLWAQKDYAFQQDFLDTLALNYDAEMRLLDFVRFPDESRIIINNWVSEKTESKIKDLIPPPLSPDTCLILVNAVYFNAAWEAPFSVEHTDDKPFYLSDGTSLTVPMMLQKNDFNYGEDKDYQGVELMYDGGEMSMVILVPRAREFEEFEKSLDNIRVREILYDFEPKKIILEMPRFTYASESVSLKDTLGQMGMPAAFSYSAADFSGMDGTLYLFIGDVLHKGFVSVDEKGTEAAAATAITGPGSGPDASEPLELTIDRPFIFFIRDIQTHTILFIGRILNPVGV
ncbi:Serpin domain-containing protein [Desulfonema magnum]|uniref:Serpin domain-containing protein n=2 Tax=Desulfonema magnum TaxID=45655 RepID=A0A975BLM2_9BACT|nr:Serpin domain-containing protein [Desulfonema magnum]